MADEAGCQPAGTGVGIRCRAEINSPGRSKTSSDSRPVRLTRERDTCRTRAVDSNERPVTCAGQKLRINQRSEQRIADVAFQAPQALRLRGRQTKTGHFNELALDSL